MFVADAGIALWIAGLLLIGFLGFFLVAVTMVFRFIGWVIRRLIGDDASENVGAGGARGGRRLVCPHPGCGHANRPTALFCGRCGRSLRRAYDVDAYG
jgi:hypothetical protein